ncbi:MAG TPA: 4Fe-4S dicluster domain-containing protein, partial [Bacteroidetes bacterium]|nr:4Fe-4S dicluster domain-containing protein [Bacteroidota bacterium]
VRNGVFEAGQIASVISALEGEHTVEAEEGAIEEEAAMDSPTTNVGSFVSQLKASAKKGESAKSLVIYETINMGTGRWANNPWLQEMPDPITKATWDNYISIPYAMSQTDGWKDGDKGKLTVNGKSITLPVIVQPGQANGTVAIQVGYGRDAVAGKVAAGVGESVYPMVGANGDTFSYSSAGMSLEKTGESITMAKTQTYIGYEMVKEGGAEKREWVEERLSDFIVKETTLSEYQNDRTSGNARPSANHMISLWNVHDKKGHHWAMAIDLNSCTGCGTCIVSCNAENNIATVGRQEVVNRREMHWMRIDRYFKGDPSDQEGNLKMVHQPMLCQHCDHAPCESVCPVLATVHSDEGLNQQIYNRCVGTRYCANNCPYKVRRFNWFSYYWNDDFKDVNSMQRDSIGRLVLNPDVTVRARGVMEKCSFCVQRIQDKKLGAKVENRKLKDGEIKTACQQSCPADAIVFGDLNDSHSEIYKLYHNKRGYHALEDVGVLPSVLYLTKVRNTEANSSASAKVNHGHAEEAH